MKRVSEAEWLIEPFYESEIRGLGWSLTSGLPSVRLEPSWCAADISWDSADAGALVARIERDYSVDLLDADRVCVRVSHGERHRLTLRARVDGGEQMLVDSVPGENRFAEFEGAVRGRRLEHLSIEVSSLAGGDGQVSLLWVVVVDSAARDRYRRLRPVYDPDWPGLLRDADDSTAAEELKSRLGLFVPDGGAEALRERARRPVYRAAWKQIRESARSHLETRPEEGIVEHLRQPVHGVGRYEHDLGRDPSPEQQITPDAMTSCALVGLIENEERYARVAARHLLAAAHCGHWDDSFMMTEPGTLWDHRAFTAMAYTEGFVRSLDWAGSLLTPTGIELAARTISTKALPMVDYSLRKYAYMRENNQAIFFASVGVLAVCALGRMLDYGGDGLDWYIAALGQSVENYVADDGGTHEGPGYHDSSVSRAIAAYEVAARYLGRPIGELMPQALLRSGNYYRVMTSTVVPGASVSTSDGGRCGQRSAGGALPALARISGDRDLHALTAALCEPDESGEIKGATALFINGPQDLAPAPAKDFQAIAPLFELMASTGILCSNRPTDDGPVRIQFLGAKADAGHGHEDKGSLVLEAYGEEMLVDRGVCFYGDPRSGLLKIGSRHSILSPNGSDGRPLHQLNPAPVAFVPSGSGDETSLRARIDVTAAWPETLRKHVRELVSDDPAELIIRDAVVRTKLGSVSLHFQSRTPWVRNGNGWTTTGTRAQLTVEPLWSVAASESEEDLFDSNYTPVYRLSLFTGEGPEFELETRVAIDPIGGQSDQGGVPGAPA